MLDQVWWGAHVSVRRFFTLDGWMPARFASEPFEVRRQARVVISAVLVANVVSAVLILGLWALGDNGSAARLALTIPLQSSPLLLLRWEPRVAAHLFMLILFFEVVFDFGPDAGVGLFAAAVLPIAAAAVLGRAACAVWTAIAVCWAAALAPLWLRVGEYPLELALGAGLMCLVAGIVGFVMESNRIVLMREAFSSRHQLLSSEQTMRRFVDQVFPAHVITDDSGLIEITEAAVELVGYDGDAWMGLDVNNLIHPDDIPKVMEEVGRSGSSIHLEVRVRHAEGDWIWLEVFGAELDGGRPGPNGVRRLFAGRDIRDERRSRERLIQAQRLEGVGVLAAGVAHDFNNLLTVINGFAELLPDSEERMHILHAVEDASLLTAGLTAFGKGNVGGSRAVDVSGSVRKWEPIFKSLLGATSKLEMALPNDPVGAAVSEGQLNQILLNLITNAKEAMGDEGLLSIAVADAELNDQEAQAQGVSPGRYVRLTVADNGRGMPADVLERAYDPYYSTKTGSRSSGLGLSSVYGIVTQQGGAIDIVSQEGEGTTVVVLLPYQRTPATLPRTLSTGEHAAIRRGRTILLAEDDELVRVWLERTLRQHGFEVVSAAHVAAALSRSTDEIDLLLTDIVMPGARGTELALQLRQSRPDLPVVFMSAYADAEVSDWRELSEGQVGFLAKPFSADALVAEIEERLSGARVSAAV